MNSDSMKNFQKLNLFQVTILSAILAGFANVFVFSLIKLVHVGVFIPLQPGTLELIQLNLARVILATIIPAFFAGGLFWFLKKFFPKKALYNFMIISIGFLVFSFFSPFALPVSLMNKLVLCLLHIIAATFIFGTFYNFDKMNKNV